MHPVTCLAAIPNLGFCSLCIFWTFLLDSLAILGSRCEGFYCILTMYSKTLSVPKTIMKSDPDSRSKNTYGVCVLTQREFVKTRFWIFSNSFQSRLRDAATPYFHSVKEYFKCIMATLPSFQSSQSISIPFMIGRNLMAKDLKLSTTSRGSLLYTMHGFSLLRVFTNITFVLEPFT
ncbi:hypothetical protein GOP47_0011863, partial [Adiantum capillus-veneris]